ncbi:hypothetical protein [Actinomadura rupiterrae]|uniref:hypothetical protein n=1 Tax=Actinomadura rupiterrae TaxID=559627 RepID=UPI0020A28770|nr:hypothetical protein [Actinomadura rupiterrae]MCP2340594.1 hypothetical protein [Actinomadura rupiterrae]
MEIEALEERLREDPGDLASWDVYGARLRERGDTRGEVIRLERRRARTSPARRDPLDQELAALLAEHRTEWDAALPKSATVLERRFGFATRVAVEWSDNAPVDVDQVLRSPFVTALRIAPGDDTGDYWDEDYDRDEDGEPEPSASIDTGALATLSFGRVTELDLSYLRIGALGARTLAVATYLRAEAEPARITTLDLRYCAVGNSGLAALAESPSFAGVRTLRLQKNSITAAGVAALHRFEGLTELDLRYNPIGAEGVRTLLGAPFAGSLERLLLNRADVIDVSDDGTAGEDGAPLLADAPQLPPALRAIWRCR